MILGLQKFYRYVKLQAFLKNTITTYPQYKRRKKNPEIPTRGSNFFTIFVLQINDNHCALSLVCKRLRLFALVEPLANEIGNDIPHNGRSDCDNKQRTHTTHLLSKVRG